MVHIFPEGRMCSVRHTLLVWLLPVFLLVGATSACVSYMSYNRVVGGFMDDQMQLLAESIAVQKEEIVLLPMTSDRVHREGTYVVQVFDAQGTLRGSSLPGTEVGLQIGSGFHTVAAGSEHWRAYAAQATRPGNGFRVQVLQSGQFRTFLAAGRAWGVIAPLIVLLPLALLVLWWVVSQVSLAVGRIASQASAQDENSITELSTDRVPLEIKPLVVSFNSLLGRLREAFATQRHFVQDAAHELRTPIAAVGLQLENLRGDIAPGEAMQRFNQLEAGVKRAQRLVDQLLKLSRQEGAAQALPQISAVNVHDAVLESVNALIAQADRRGIDLGLDEAEGCADATTTVNSPPGDLRSVLDNLIENALRYTPRGGVVDVRVSRAQGKCAIEVVDTGPGIPPEELGRVFDRFYRVPGTEAPGSGLGLSIAQAAAKRCGMRLSLRNRDDCSGLVARLECC